MSALRSNRTQMRARARLITLSLQLRLAARVARVAKLTELIELAELAELANKPLPIKVAIGRAGHLLILTRVRLLYASAQ